MNCKETVTNNGTGLLITNHGEIFDATLFMPNTEKSDDFLPKMNIINEQEYSGKISNRIAGILKWALVNFTEGQRDDTLYKLGTFLKNIGEEYDYHIISVNNMCSDALPSGDIDKIIRSIRNTTMKSNI